MKMKKIELVVSGHPVQVEVKKDGKTPTSSCWLAMAVEGAGRGEFYANTYLVWKITRCFIFAQDPAGNDIRFSRTAVAYSTGYCWIQRSPSGTIYALNKDGYPIAISGGDENPLDPSLKIIKHRDDLSAQIYYGYYHNCYRRISDLPSCCFPPEYYVAFEKVTPPSNAEKSYADIDSLTLFLLQEGYFRDYKLISEEDFSK